MDIQSKKLLNIKNKFCNSFFQNHDFRDIKTAFCFLDETGLLCSPRDKFFAIGLLKVEKPELVYNEIRRIRSKYNYNEEVKWSKLDTKIRFDIARDLFNIFLSSDAKFNCIVLDKSKLNFTKYFQDDLFKVYTNFSVALMKLIIGKTPSEILVVLADDYFSPKGKNIEEKIKKYTNDHYKDFVVAGVCQIDSKSSDLLQLADLILGAVVYDLKINRGVISGNKSSHKRKFLNFVYQKLNIKKSFFFKNGFKSRNYTTSGDKLRATIFDSKRSKASKFCKK